MKRQNEFRTDETRESVLRGPIDVLNHRHAVDLKFQQIEWLLDEIVLKF
jgi:hypothetical protein